MLSAVAVFWWPLWRVPCALSGPGFAMFHFRLHFEAEDRNASAGRRRELADRVLENCSG
jgi:hypothetical protein